ENNKIKFKNANGFIAAKSYSNSPRSVTIATTRTNCSHCYTFSKPSSSPNWVNRMPYELYVNDLSRNEYQPYFQTYIDLVDETNIREQLQEQAEKFKEVLSGVSEEVASCLHPPYSWTIKQVVGHLIDGEKIFGVRAHRIACAEGLPLPGFDQNIFVANTDYEPVALSALVQEFIYNRASNQLMLDRWTSGMWTQTGICDGKPISVRAVACLLVGHVNHHLRIIEKRLETH
ncbi:MAG: DinB family protein, partial [Planctomycetota bacterium]